MRFYLRLLCLIASLVSPVALAQSNELRGRVVGVSDGDTITVLDGSNTQYKIRFNGIDAPESAQDFGQAAKKNLSSLVFGKDVSVRWSKKDRYGRIVGTVMIGATNINLEQLKGGFAWYYRQYASDVPPENRSVYERAEAEARATRRGLWSQPNPTPPWAFRHPDQAQSSPASAAQPSGKIIGNRNSQIYHLSNCPDYTKTAEKNRVYFASEADAQRAGFRKARNCP